MLQSRRKLCFSGPLFIWSGRYMKLLTRLDWGHTTESGSTEKTLLIHFSSPFLPLCSPVNLFCEIQQCLSASLTTSASSEMGSLMQAGLIFTVQGGIVTGRRVRERCEDEGTSMWSSRWEKWIWKSNLILYFKAYKIFLGLASFSCVIFPCWWQYHTKWLVCL